MGIVTINGGDFPRDSRSIINDNFNFLDSATFKLDQTNRQTVIGGVPIFNNGLESNNDTLIGPSGHRFYFTKEPIDLNVTEGDEETISPLPTGDVPTYSTECPSCFAQYKGRSVFGLMEGNPSGHTFSSTTSNVDTGFLMAYVNNNNYDLEDGIFTISADQFAFHRRIGTISGYAPATVEANIAHFFTTTNEATYAGIANNDFTIINAGVYGGVNQNTKNNTGETVDFINYGILSEIIDQNRELSGTSNITNTLFVGNLVTYSIADNIENEANGDVFNIFMLTSEYQSKNTDFNYTIVDGSSKNTNLFGLSHSTKIQDSKVCIHSSVVGQDILRLSRSSNNATEGTIVFVVDENNFVGINTDSPDVDLDVRGELFSEYQTKIGEKDDNYVEFNNATINSGALIDSKLPILNSVSHLYLTDEEQTDLGQQNMGIGISRGMIIFSDDTSILGPNPILTLTNGLIGSEEEISSSLQLVLDTENYSASDIGKFLYSNEFGHKFDSNIEIPSTDSFYIGSPDSDGSWRFSISGGNLVIQKRETGSWVTKSTIPA